MLSDPQVLVENQWPHKRALLAAVRGQGCQTALATMSNRRRAAHVLAVLDLQDEFDFIATREDVENGKLDPEIYHLVATQLGVLPADCLVIEDSPSGVAAALAAGMYCVAVATPFTRDRLHASGLLPPGRVVDQGADLMAVVEQVMGPV